MMSSSTEPNVAFRKDLIVSPENMQLRDRSCYDEISNDREVELIKYYHELRGLPRRAVGYPAIGQLLVLRHLPENLGWPLRKLEILWHSGILRLEAKPGKSHRDHMH